jgi:formate/nitrite transporter
MYRVTVSVLALLALQLQHGAAFQTPKPVKTTIPLDSSTVADFMEVVVPNKEYFVDETKEKPDQQVITKTTQLSVTQPQIDLSKVSNILTPAEAYESLVAKGEYNANASTAKTLFSAVLGGCYVGMGGMLSLAVAGNSPDLAQADPGLYKFLFGALFPVNLLLALQCGGQLYTGNTANMMAAVCEGRATLPDMGRNLGLSWVGNFIGCAGFALACKYAGVLEGGAGQLAASVLATKTSYELGPLMVKAMFCNWLVCLAVYLSMQAKDMGGKYLSIWLPVSTFVSIGFEHSVANMFLLPAGLMSTDDISVETALFHNLLPVTLGNAISGSLFVGAAMSFMYGRLGEETTEH